MICGYENMFGKRAEFTYKALMHVDAYGLRKKEFIPIINDNKAFKEHMLRYTLEYYHTIIRKPMLKYKKNILSQVTKR